MHPGDVERVLQQLAGPTGSLSGRGRAMRLVEADVELAT